MPSKSKKQAATMRAAAHNPAFAKHMGIPMDVAMEFTHSDEGRDLRKLPMHTKKKRK